MQDAEARAGAQPQAEDSPHFQQVTIREERRALRIQVTILGGGRGPSSCCGSTKLAPRQPRGKGQLPRVGEACTEDAFKGGFPGRGNIVSLNSVQKNSTQVQEASRRPVG